MKLTHQQISCSGLLLASTVGALSLVPPADAESVSFQESKQNDSQVLLQQQGRLEQGDAVLPSDGSIYDQYTFDGQAGQEVTVSLSSNEFDTYLAILGPDGDVVGENDDSGNSTNSEITVTLSVTGTYTVVANAYDTNGRGRYTVMVTARDRVATTPRPDPSSPPSDCPEYSYEGFYARVTTRDGDNVRVRATPNGRVIGSIPSGWEVIVQERDSTGNWTRVTSHYGEGDINVFVSAPNFENGWVSTAFLTDLGYSCDKPSAPWSLLQPQLFGQRDAVVGEDWIARGDRIAQVVRTKQTKIQ
ncbi:MULTISPECIES: pre-peptidase C-terminal domain-containing protein [unclassified Leptolyngbya]|uniref:pre-peptidase C-terminal domain-containing protein n=1 Tax=unclassified Leptolyngbya TaxID=2650499 RepID=UPI0016878EC7|nr:MULTISPECIES: pre-peptidase C-terminal domain-containing protein [unclassified Leptolyngbya]MBD1909054.1 pre-peptidase C-terminal domain-containing protein [Leptolyngbya sp. FACHB-8]MBD2157435.1 pre-peptidase C-terminal domain-containing protein [Leptolyngbya sp. FACHB-16]